MNKLNSRLNVFFFSFQSILKSTSLPGGGVNVFAALLHTHLAGNALMDTDITQTLSWEQKAS